MATIVNTMIVGLTAQMVQARLNTADAKPFLFGTYFPVKKVNGFIWRTLTNQLSKANVAADLHTDNGTIVRKRRPIFESAKGDIPFISISRDLTRAEIKDYQTALAYAQDADATKLVQYWGEDVDFCFNGVQSELEFIAWKLASNAGKLAFTTTNNATYANEFDLELWIGGLQRINQAGITRLGVIHRGFSTYEKKIYRNLPMWHIPIELRRRCPNLPIICDPSHIGGARELVAPLCQQAMDLGFDGLIIESHCNPDAAWSDAKQQVTPDVLDFILDKLVIRNITESTESLDTLRQQIDEIDNSLIELLAKRMRISREIGQYKKEHDMTVVQTMRYTEILDKRGAQGVLCGMDADFIKAVFENIHEESVRQQMDVMNKD